MQTLTKLNKSQENNIYDMQQDESTRDQDRYKEDPQRLKVISEKIDFEA